MPTPLDDALRSKVGSLAEAGDWTALYELLRGEARADLLADRDAAYRFAESLYHTGRMDELASYAAGFEESARGASDPEGVMRALNLAGIAAFELGDTEGARTRFDALMELAEASHDKEMLARASNNLGAIANLKGRRHEALAYYHLAIPLYQRLGQPRGLAQAYHNLGHTYRDMGRPDECIASYTRAIVLAEEIDYKPLIAMSTVGRAEAEVRRGDVALARELAERGLSLARTVRDPISETEALRVRGLVYCAGGDDTTAIEDLEYARSLARETKSTLLEAEIERDIGTLRLGAGRAKEARANFEAALDLFESLGAAAESRAVRLRLESIDE
jgi:tetratricopeptide (TPR) repeat protein